MNTSPSDISATDPPRWRQGNLPLALSALLLIGVFVLDLLTPRGVAVGFLYAASLLLAPWFARAFWIAVVAGTGAVLVAVGYLVAAPAGSDAIAWMALANRGLAVLVLIGGGLLAAHHHRSVAERREGEANLKAVQHLTGAGHFQLIAGDEAADRWSEQALVILGRSTTDQLSRQAFIDQYADPLDRARVRAAFHAALEQGVGFELTFRIARRDGSIRHVKAVGEPLRSKGGGIARVIGGLVDISAQKQTEAALQGREARLRSILETAPEAIITINASGIVESYSTAAEHLFGYTADEVIGRNVSLLMPSPDRERHDSYLQRYLSTGEARIIGIGRVVQGRKKDGSIVPLELAVGEIVLDGERTFTGFLRDLTVRQRMEQELRQAQKMEAIGQLAGGIAHDFNNLLTVILGNLEMLEKRSKPEDRQWVLIQEMRETAELGAQLTDRLLTFGRRQSLQPKPVDIGGLIADTATLLRRTLGETIQVNTSVTPNLAMALVDQAQLQNAILNLALNARDAMPRGGVLAVEAREVELDADYVETHPNSRLGRYVMISVTDTGTGMPPEVRERAFEPFFTTKGTGAGTGLGLSMVYGFATQTGGHVHLYSGSGLGTTVRLYLPVARDQAHTQRSSPEQVSVPEGHGETILVVEDDPGVRRVSVSRVRELGYRVIEAENGPAALDHLDDGAQIDLLFTDIIMPGGMTGVELAQRVRQRLPGTAVLFTSGYAEPELLQLEGIKKSTLLKKPYTAAVLGRALRDLLEGRRTS